MTASLAPVPNPYEANARSAKAFALVDAWDALVRRSGLDPYADAPELGELLETLPDPFWRQLAVSAGQRPPSDVTKALVVARVRSRGPLGQRSRGVGRVVAAFLAAGEAAGNHTLQGQELLVRAAREADRGRS